MFDIENSSRSITLSHVEKFDVIEYGNENLEKSIYVVFKINKDDSIPAILLELWKFKGGFDHAFANVMEIDFSVNKRVRFYLPIKSEVEILKITSYRSENTDLTDKEMFYFDVMPKNTSKIKTKDFNIPFQCDIKINNKIYSVLLPSWTPIQQLPLLNIHEGSKIEVWKIENELTIMKVIKI